MIHISYLACIPLKYITIEFDIFKIFDILVISDVSSQLRSQSGPKSFIERNIIAFNSILLIGLTIGIKIFIDFKNSFSSYVNFLYGVFISSRICGNIFIGFFSLLAESKSNASFISFLTIFATSFIIFYIRA